MLGSTSAYGSGQPALVDEHTPVDHSIPRVQSEEYLRENVWGDYLTTGGAVWTWDVTFLIGCEEERLNTRIEYVNLIHIEDVAVICLTAIEEG